MFEKDNMLHFGTPRRSGRYPWGSGEDPRNGSAKFLSQVDDMRARGIKDVDIASKLGMNTTQLRNNITWANKELREHRNQQMDTLKESGLNNTAIGNKIGVSEGTVRKYFDSKEKVEKMQLEHVGDALKSGVDKSGYLDVGIGVERQLGVARTKFNTAVNKLVEDEGYYIHEVHVKRLSDNTVTDAANGVFAKYTTIKVLTKDPDVSNTRKNSDKIKHLDSQSDDKSITPATTIGPPKMMNLDRVKVRYAEEGGTDKDGLIEMRPGAEGLDLGNSKYAQVRIGAGDNLYMKGMAVYSKDKFPDGVDVIYNTNKKKGTPKEKVLKTMEQDMDNPFGANIIKQKGHINIVNEQGDWDKWSTTISSQFLAKQPLIFIKDRLDDTYSGLRNEYDEINSMTNPVVKKYLMEKYNEGLDSKARHLKAKGIPNTKSHVILPVPSLKENEVYAPNYKNGDIVVLVRHPHGGKFEIPELIVNNKSTKARDIMGVSSDAIGIHPTVANKLSGADFDGDTVLVMPNHNRQIKVARSLKELKNFDHLALYKVDKDSPANLHKKDKKTGELVNTGVTIVDKTKQMEMGKITNLITDMSIKGASDSEIARAVRHSMVVIDSEKHNLNYKKSAEDNGISALRKKYQSHVNPETGKTSIGASTLLSVSKRKVDISNPSFDPDKLSSGRAQEHLYSNYIKGVMSVKNESTKNIQSIKLPKYSKEAAKIYAPEVESLNAKLHVALLNAPRERQAQLMTNSLFFKHVKPGMDKDDIKKLKSRSLARARVATGAKKSQIQITDKEWEAIQSRAVSNTKLLDILKNADMDIVRKLASPRALKLSSAKASRAKALLNSGYTYAEVAQAMGVSTSTLRTELGGE